MALLTLFVIYLKNKGVYPIGFDRRALHDLEEVSFAFFDLLDLSVVLVSICLHLVLNRPNELFSAKNKQWVWRCLLSKSWR